VKYTLMQNVTNGAMYI